MASKLELIQWNGKRFSVSDVQLRDGVLVGKGDLAIAVGACEVVKPGVYFVGVDDVTMRTEADFHDLRRRIAMRSLFDNTGDLMDMARNIAMFLSVIIAIGLWLQVGGMRGDLSSVQAQQKHVVDTLSKPVQIVAPSDTPGVAK